MLHLLSITNCPDYEEVGPIDSRSKLPSSLRRRYPPKSKEVLPVVMVDATTCGSALPRHPSNSNIALIQGHEHSHLPVLSSTTGPRECLSLFRSQAENGCVAFCTTHQLPPPPPRHRQRLGLTLQSRTCSLCSRSKPHAPAQPRRRPWSQGRR